MERWARRLEEKHSVEWFVAEEDFGHLAVVRERLISLLFSQMTVLPT